VRNHVRTAAVSLLAIALFAWFLRHANLGDIWAAVRRARTDMIAASLALVAVTYWTRVVRWQYLLAPLAPTRFSNALRTTVIGFAASFLLPARAGDVLRPYLMARREGLAPASTFATIIVERVLDLIAVLALLAFYVWGSGARSVPASLLRPVQISALLAAAAAVFLMAVMFVLAKHPERVGNFVRGMNRVLPHRLADGLAGLARTFSEGLAVARTPRPLVLALLWSFPVWILIALEAWFVTRAFGIEMPSAGSFLVQGLLVIGVAVPTPGAVGGFHEAYRIGVTSFFGASNDAAVAAAIVLHAVSFVPVTLVGVIFMAGDGLSVSGLRGMTGVAQEAETKDVETGTDEVPLLRPSGR
jgi:glycosyltransferase 2 family protein